MISLVSVLIPAAAGFVAWACARYMLHHANRTQLVQTPNHRSSHVNPTPTGGGLGIVCAGTMLGAALMTNAEWLSGWALLILALLIAAVGFWDDVRCLPAKLRFSVQLAVCCGLLLALHDQPLAAAGVLLLFVGVWWINLFNFMDGIDGIAGAQAVFMLVAAAGLAVFAKPDVTADPVWIWMLGIASATAGLLILNWAPARIFMGDAGSMYLGFMIFALALASIHAGWLAYPEWLVLGALFAADATVTLVTRIARGERWHHAHRSHAYQRLSRRWRAHQPVTLLAIAINLLWLAPLAWACQLWPDFAWLIVAIAYTPLLAGAFALGAGRPDGA